MYEYFDAAKLDWLPLELTYGSNMPVDQTLDPRQVYKGRVVNVKDQRVLKIVHLQKPPVLNEKVQLAIELNDKEYLLLKLLSDTRWYWGNSDIADESGNGGGYKLPKDLWVPGPMIKEIWDARFPMTENEIGNAIYRGDEWRGVLDRLRRKTDKVFNREEARLTKISKGRFGSKDKWFNSTLQVALLPLPIVKTCKVATLIERHIPAFIKEKLEKQTKHVAALYRLGFDIDIEDREESAPLQN